MNLRPPGYEPGELPDCSTPRRGKHCTTLGPAIYHAAVLLAVWIALAVYLAVVAYGLLRAVTRGLNTMRAMRRLNRGLAERLVTLNAATAAAERKAAAASEGTAQLTSALERLQRSLAELQVLRGAAAEAAAVPASVRNLIPRK